MKHPRPKKTFLDKRVRRYENLLEMYMDDDFGLDDEEVDKMERLESNLRGHGIDVLSIQRKYRPKLQGPTNE